MVVQGAIRLFFAYSPSFIKVFLLRVSGANVGKGVRILFGSWIRAKKISIGNHVRIGKDGRLETGELILEDHVFLGDRFKILGPKSIRIGEYTEAYEGFEVNGSERVTIGENCWIGERTLFNAQADIHVGNGVGIGRECQLWTHGYFAPILNGYPSKIGPITIQDDCWLTPRVIVLPGVVIGKSSLLGAGSVVTKNVSPCTMNTGIPAKEIATEEEYRISLDSIRKKEMLKQYLFEKLTLMNYEITLFGERMVCAKEGHGFTLHYITSLDSTSVSIENLKGENVFFFFGDVDQTIKSLLGLNEKATYFDIERREYLKKSLRAEILLKKILNENMIRFNRSPISEDQTQ
jgi:acetyltransferase-like isoleucine patch superfamily enzyme